VLYAWPLVFIFVGLALYTVLGGADFGAGFWQLFAGRGARGEHVREYAHKSIGPVWEANHVWLIFVITVFWTAYPEAFASIASTLAIPLFIALIGIVARGAAYALREGAANAREAGVIDTTFSLSSILTPFALGAAIGAIATDRVPVGNAAGDMVSSWTSATSIFIGLLAVATSAYLAAVYLAADAHRDGETELEREFRARALGSGVVAGAIALAGIFVVEHDSHRLFHSLLTGRALAAVIVSVLAGIATLALVYRRRFEPARYSAAVAVAAILAGWALSRWPELLPGLTVRQAAAGHDTLVALVVSVIAGAIVVFPALAVLFRLTLRGGLTGYETGTFPPAPARPPRVKTRLPERAAIACLVAGFGLLSVAETPWAHAAGVVCLCAFVLLGFYAIVVPALSQLSTTSK
jgi:cytochrome d ubiquinol oxidase subunit II